MTNDFEVREATPGDAPAIADVLTGAFPTDAEARLVTALQAENDVMLTLVATDAGAVAGCVVFSRMQVDMDGTTIAGAGLAPLAVRSAWQGRGAGGALVRAGLSALAARDVALVFVLGDPRYYGRFGFDAAIAKPFASPYAGAHFMARWLGPVVEGRTGRAGYAPTFAKMGSPA